MRDYYTDLLSTLCMARFDTLARHGVNGNYISKYLHKYHTVDSCYPSFCRKN